MTYEEYRKQVLKLDKPRKHNVKGSLGVYDAYKWIRKNKWFSLPSPLSENTFYSIIRTVNNLIAERMALGESFVLPEKMGIIEMRKHKPYTKYVDGKIKSTYPVDWDKTLKLWHEDKDSRDNKILVKDINKIIFKVIYNKGKAKFNNKCFYHFLMNRTLNTKIKMNVYNKIIDLFLLQDE